MECSDELQARCAGFVEAEIERYREALVEDADEPEEGDEADGEDETGDSDDDVAEKRRKKKANAKRAEEKRAKAQGKKKALKVRTPAEIRGELLPFFSGVEERLIASCTCAAENAKSQARLVAAGLFDRTIGAFVRAVHHDIISLHHASVILIHLERFDATFDLWAKLLVQDMRDEGIYGDAGSTVARIAVDSLKGVRCLSASLTLASADFLFEVRPVNSSSTRRTPPTATSSPSPVCFPPPSSCEGPNSPLSTVCRFRTTFSSTPTRSHTSLGSLQFSRRARRRTPVRRRSPSSRRSGTSSSASRDRERSRCSWLIYSFQYRCRS